MLLDTVAPMIASDVNSDNIDATGHQVLLLAAVDRRRWFLFGGVCVFKAIILLKRRDGISSEEFAAWWLGRHRPLAMQLPGLRRMVVNLCRDPEAVYDGASELWFDSEADFVAGYATEIGKEVAADSLSMVSRRDRLLVSEHVFHAQPAGAAG